MSSGKSAAAGLTNKNETPRPAYSRSSRASVGVYLRASGHPVPVNAMTSALLAA